MMAHSFTIFHTNDMHDRRDVFPLLARTPRDEQTLLVDAGDALRGSNTLAFWNEPILGLMNEAGYAAQAMGNREFHYLRGILAHRQAGRRFPLLAANLQDVRGRADHLWEKSVVLEVGGWRVGLTGVTPVQYDDASVWLSLTGLRFLPPETVLPEVVADLRRRCHLVVLLSHVGFEADRRLAGAVPGVDLLIGGHCHTQLEEPCWVGGVPIVQTGSHARFLGRVDLALSPAGAVEGINYQLLPTRDEQETARAA